MRSVLVHVERHDHVPAQRHRRVRDEPVALDLRDEAPDPRAELDALGVELDGRAELVAAPARVVEVLVLDVLPDVLQRVAKGPAGAGRRRRHGRPGVGPARTRGSPPVEREPGAALVRGLLLCLLRLCLRLWLGLRPIPGRAPAGRAPTPRRAPTCSRASTAADWSGWAAAHASAPGDPGPRARLWAAAAWKAGRAWAARRRNAAVQQPARASAIRCSIATTSAVRSGRRRGRKMTKSSRVMCHSTDSAAATTQSRQKQLDPLPPEHGPRTVA